MKLRDMGRVNVTICWNCKPVNASLKEATFVCIYCWQCKHWYFKGRDLTAPKAVVT